MSENLNVLEESLEEFFPSQNNKRDFYREEKAARGISTCPKCDSPFLTDSQCESCGFQLKEDFYGEAFGAKSFYQLKQDFWHSLSFARLKMEELTFWLSPKKKHYLNKLELRLNEIIDFLASPNLATDSRRPFFLLELADLLTELKKLGLNEEEIWLRLNKEMRGNQFVVKKGLELSERRLNRLRSESFSRLLFRMMAYGVMAVICGHILVQFKEFF